MASGTPPPDPSGISRFLGFFRGIGGNILELARITFGGEATVGRLIFFAIGLLGLVCLGAMVFFAYHNKTTELLISFGILALVIVVLLSRMAWRLEEVKTPHSTPAGGPPLGLDIILKERDEARRERDEAVKKGTDSENQLTTLNTKATDLENRLSVALSGLEKETKRANTQTGINHLYEYAIDAISTHYQRVVDRFPAILENEVTITVDETGAARMTERRVLAASGKKIHNFLIDEITGTVPLKSFLDLKFELQLHTDPTVRTIAWLPGRGNLVKYEVMYTFLPALRGEDQLGFSVTYSWPDVFRDLLDPNKEKDFYSIRIRSAATVPVVRFIFRIHPQIPPLKLTNRGNVVGVCVPHSSNIVTDDYRIYQWEAYNVPDEAQVAVWLELL